MSAVTIGANGGAEIAGYDGRLHAQPGLQVADADHVRGDDEDRHHQRHGRKTGDPADDEQFPADGQIGLVVGSVLPVRTIIGSVKDDLRDPATIIYRRRLTAAQFARLKATVRHVRATEHYWHLMFFNCNDIAVEATKSIGLRSPSPWLIPHAYVTALRAMN